MSAFEDTAVERSGGMSMKTGMVLARAKLAESASGVIVAQDRHRRRSWARPRVPIETTLETKLHGNVAHELSAQNYGPSQWWVLL